MLVFVPHIRTVSTARDVIATWQIVVLCCFFVVVCRPANPAHAPVIDQKIANATLLGDKTFEGEMRGIASRHVCSDQITLSIKMYIIDIDLHAVRTLTPAIVAQYRATRGTRRKCRARVRAYLIPITVYTHTSARSRTDVKHNLYPHSQHTHAAEAAADHTCRRAMGPRTHTHEH